MYLESEGVVYYNYLLHLLWNDYLHLFSVFLSIMKLWVAGKPKKHIVILPGIIKLSWMSSSSMVAVILFRMNITVNNTKRMFFLGMDIFSIPCIPVLFHISSIDAITITLTISPNISPMVIIPFLPVLFNISFIDWLT